MITRSITIDIRDWRSLVIHPMRENPNTLKTFPNQPVPSPVTILYGYFAIFFILSIWSWSCKDMFGIWMQHSSINMFRTPHMPLFSNSIKSNTAHFWIVILLVCYNCSFISPVLSFVALARTDTWRPKSRMACWFQTTPIPNGLHPPSQWSTSFLPTLLHTFWLPVPPFVCHRPFLINWTE